MIRLVGTNYDTGEPVMMVFDSAKPFMLTLDSGRIVDLGGKVIGITDRDGKVEIAVEQ